jgi:hypothetical protein
MVGKCYVDMKKILLICACIAISFSVLAQRKFSDMIGRWDIAGEQNAGASLEIIDSSTMILNYMGETRRISNIKMDFSKTPVWIDFTTQDSSATLQTIKGLVEIGDNVMKWQLFVDEERTRYFTSRKGELLYLKRAAATTGTAKSTPAQ